MESEELLEKVSASASVTYARLQRLTFILERKGLLTKAELAEIYNQSDAPVAQEP